MATTDTDKSKKIEVAVDVRQDTVLSEPVRRRIQNFLVVWLDANLDETKEDFKKSLQLLRRIVASVNTFTNAEKCFDFIREIKEEKVFMIISHSLGQRLIFDIEINAWPQLNSIYILCDKYLTPEDLAKYKPKVKSIHTSIEPIIQALEVDIQKYDRATIPMSFSGIDPLFMYTQLLKEAFLQIEDDDAKSISEFVEYFRHQDVSQLNIQRFETEYRDHAPIWWYTGPFFIFGSLNYGLRLMDTDIILKMGFFIRHLHNNIQELYDEQQSGSSEIKEPFIVYRGQGLSLENFHKMKQTKGGLMSFNNFLSTSFNRDLSLETFARPLTFREDSVGILFIITVDPHICRASTAPFADVKDVGYYKGTEEEILFTTHTIFRIEKIQRLQDEHNDRLWETNLTLAANDDHELNKLVSSLRQDVNKATGWTRLGDILIKLREPAKAKHLFNILLENATTDKDQAHYNVRLGFAYDDLGDYSTALTYYKKSLEYSEKTLLPNHPELAISYENIGGVYLNMGEYSKALSSYQRSLEIRKIALPPNHPSLATSYNNIGVVYHDIGEYSKALSSYERSLEMWKAAFPPNHPDLAGLYNNIGAVYVEMGKYSKALSSYERSLEIRKIALPPNHPDLATSYNNIAVVYGNMGEYSKALSSYERSLEIRKIALPSNHPDLAGSYNSIGGVYHNMGEYSKALSSYERSLEIQKITLPPSHPDLAGSYNNIGSVFNEMGEYSKALSSHERSLEIQKIALPPNHPSLADSYNNIGVVYRTMGEYSKALSSYERSLEIREIALQPNHPDLAMSYSNIGGVYFDMGEYSKALSSQERSLEIQKIALPPNHPSLADSYNNIGLVYRTMGEYSKALSSYERSLEIREIALPPNHPNLGNSYEGIGEVYEKMGEYSKALSLIKRSLEIWRAALPLDHPYVANAYNGLGLVHNHLKEYSEARSSFEKAMEIREKALTPNHPELATSYNDIGLMYGHMRDYKQSLAFLEKALDIREKSLPRDHPHILKTKTNIAELKQKMS